MIWTDGSSDRLEEGGGCVRGEGGMVCISLIDVNPIFMSFYLCPSLRLYVGRNFRLY